MKYLIPILFLVIVWSLTGCAGTERPSEPTAEDGAREWIDAIVNQDGNRMLKHTCLAQREDVQQTSMWFSAFGVLGQLFTNRSVQIEGDISDLKFETINQSDDRAEVRVYGELRIAVLGSAQAQQVDERWLIVRENDTWRWCGNPSTQAQAIASTPSSSPTPSEQRDAVPPTTAEQIAAADAFEQFASENSIQYRNAQYETTSNDGTFAKVAITAEGWDITNEAWLEFSAVINLRLIGGGWKADTGNVNVAFTGKGQATREALYSATAQAVSATAQAAESAATATSVADLAALQTDLGGTLIYLLDDGRVAVEEPGRSKTIISFGTTVDLLEIAPTGNGFYFVASEGSSIFFYNFKTEEASLLQQFESFGSIFSISVSPDNTQLLAGTLGPPQRIWTIPTSGGEVQLIWIGEGKTPTTSMISPTWTPDSNSIYAVLVPLGDVDGPPQIVNLQGEKIADLPSVSMKDPFFSQLISMSPDGNDIAFGGNVLGLLAIKNLNKTVLSNQIAPVCSPTWSREGDRLIFASGNSIFVFDLRSGELINPYNLPVSETSSTGCPLAFDWVP